MGFKEYDNYDGLGLAELVRKGEVSAAHVEGARFTAEHYQKRLIEYRKGFRAIPESDL